MTGVQTCALPICNGDGWVVKLGYYNGLQENNQTSFSVYPNPINNFISVQIDKIQTNMNYKITDQFGRIILESRFDAIENEVDLSEFHSGIYFLKVEGSNEIKKIIKN